MKIRKAVGYIVQEQRELEVDFVIDRTQVSEIVNSFFDKMDYNERRKWIFDNVPEPNAVLVDKDGNVYHKGIEVPELKGTLNPTETEDRKKAKRMTKAEKDKLVTVAALQLHGLKKQLEKTRWKKDKKPILSQIKFHSKVASAKFPRNFNREDYLKKYQK